MSRRGGSPLARFFVHTAKVEPFLRKSGDGEDLFDDPIICSPLTDTGVYAEDSRKELRTTTGDVRIAVTAVYGPLKLAQLFSLDSRVTIGGVEGRVLAVSTNTLDASMPEHFVAHLT